MTTETPTEKLAVYLISADGTEELLDEHDLILPLEHMFHLATVRRVDLLVFMNNIRLLL